MKLITIPSDFVEGESNVVPICIRAEDSLGNRIAEGWINGVIRVADGLPAGEGVVLPCSYWLADNLALMVQDAEARGLFREAVAHESEALAPNPGNPAYQKRLAEYRLAAPGVGSSPASEPQPAGPE